MFSHIMIGTNDIEESRVFYDKLFEVLGARPGKMIPSRTGLKRYFYNFKDTSLSLIPIAQPSRPQRRGDGGWGL